MAFWGITLVEARSKSWLVADRAGQMLRETEHDRTNTFVLEYAYYLMTSQLKQELNLGIVKISG